MLETSTIVKSFDTDFFVFHFAIDAPQQFL